MFPLSFCNFVFQIKLFSFFLHTITGEKVKYRLLFKKQNLNRSAGPMGCSRPVCECVQLVRATRASTTFPMCSRRLRSATALEISISDICTHTKIRLISTQKGSRIKLWLKAEIKPRATGKETENELTGLSPTSNR